MPDNRQSPHLGTTPESLSMPEAGIPRRLLILLRSPMS